MTKSQAEMLLLGGACLVGPVVGCVVALPVHNFTGSDLWAIVIGSIFGIGTYVLACILHIKAYPDVDANEPAEAQMTDKPSAGASSSSSSSSEEQLHV